MSSVNATVGLTPHAGQWAASGSLDECCGVKVAVGHGDEGIVSYGE